MAAKPEAILLPRAVGCWGLRATSVCFSKGREPESICVMPLPQGGDWDTHGDPLLLGVDPLLGPCKAALLVLGELLIGHKLIQKQLDPQQLRHHGAVLPGHTHQEGQRPKDVGADELRHKAKGAAGTWAGLGSVGCPTTTHRPGTALSTEQMGRPELYLEAESLNVHHAPEPGKSSVDEG